MPQALPHFYCKTGKDGNPVYYERSGQTDLAKARRAGIDWLVWCVLFLLGGIWSCEKQGVLQDRVRCHSPL